MANVINTNISSLNAQRNLSTSQSSLATSLQRLSTGLRINSAKDDAAGQAISTRMTAQINGMQQASRNANDGISMSQTAEGAMGSINDILLRMRDLSVQASNGTNGTNERVTIQNEVDQLYQEIDRISGSTDFNGIKLLDGSAKSNSFQIGANAGQTISFGIQEVSTKSMALNSTASASGDLNSGRVNITGLTGSTKLNINDMAISFGATDDSAMEVVTAINKKTDATGVTATANNVVKGTSGATGVLDGVADKLSITVQNSDGTAGIAVDIKASKDMNELVANINRQVGGITAALDDKGALTLSNDTGATISIVANGNAASLSGLTDSTNNGYLSLTGPEDGAIKVTGDDMAKFGFNASVGAGKVAGTQTIGAAAVVATDPLVALNAAGGTTGALAAADKVKINGIELKQDAFKTAFSAADKAAAINSLTAQTGVTASAKTDAFVEMSDAEAQVFKINGASYTTAATGSIQDMANQINAKYATGTSGGVSASVDAASGKLHLSSSTGGDIKFETTTATASIKVSSTADSTQTTVAQGSGLAVRGEISLSSEGGAAIKLEDGAATPGNGLKKLGLVAQGGSADAVLGGKLDVTTQANAQAAIASIDKAISYVAEQRATMGAVQNRLNTTISNLASATENTTSARSRIQDTDFATETASMTRGQILQQAGTAMLAQANSLPNGVLSLLRG